MIEVTRPACGPRPEDPSAPAGARRADLRGPAGRGGQGRRRSSARPWRARWPWRCRCGSAWRRASPGESCTSVVLGLAGGYCAGKDAVAAILAERGFRVIDVDGVGHRVLREPEARELVARPLRARGAGPRWGGGPPEAGPQGVPRPAGAGRAGGDRAPAAWSSGSARSWRAGRGPVVLNAALLFRMGLDRLCGAVLCVRAPWWARLARARRRDGLGLVQGLRRIASQRGICPKLPGPGVDIYYVDNAGGPDALRERVLRLAAGERAGQLSMEGKKVLWVVFSIALALVVILAGGSVPAAPAPAEVRRGLRDAPPPRCRVTTPTSTCAAPPIPPGSPHLRPSPQPVVIVVGEPPAGEAPAEPSVEPLAAPGAPPERAYAAPVVAEPQERAARTPERPLAPPPRRRPPTESRPAVKPAAKPAVQSAAKPAADPPQTGLQAEVAERHGILDPGRLLLQRLPGRGGQPPAGGAGPGGPHHHPRPERQDALPGAGRAVRQQGRGGEVPGLDPGAERLRNQLHLHGRQPALHALSRIPLVSRRSLRRFPERSRSPTGRAAGRRRRPAPRAALPGGPSPARPPARRGPAAAG